MCVYNTLGDTVIELNDAVRSHSNCDSTLKVELVLSSECKRYIKLDDIPCKLSTLSIVQNNIVLMSMSLAHTKKWTQTSDLVSLTDMTSDGVWEWFPELDF